MEHYMTPSPLVKHEDVPADEGMMPSLFSAECSPSMDTVDLWATPDRDLSSPIPEATPEPGEKKPKKRKSWGQVLPEPKTSLPPRKRAKTEDEKEQRRVERVLRNRRAAQSSRERKRQETEALAMRNKELEDALLMLSQRNEQLEKELKKVRPEYTGSSTAASASSPTLSQALVLTPPPTKPDEDVDLDEKPRMSQGAVDLINDIIKSHQGTPNTCNPASISPALSPVAEETDFAAVPSYAMAGLDKDDSVHEKTTDSTTRSTQYSAVSTAGGVDVSYDTHVAAFEPGNALFGNFTEFDEFGDIPSPESSLIDFDHPPRDEFSVDLDFLDQFVYTNDMHAGDGAIDDQQPQQEDVAPQNSQEAPYQQPPAGASSTGCDARGTAVQAH